MAKLKLEQLMYDEEKQRLRADAAERYRLQLENFVDMICHEIRNPYVGDEEREGVARRGGVIGFEMFDY